MITIKEARTQAKLTQKQLSERYQIPVRSIEDWEANRRTPPEYVVNLLLRCLEADFGVKLKDPTQATLGKKFKLTYADGGLLSTVDEMFVNTEKQAKRVSLIKADSDTVKTYECSNGFKFKAELI